MDCATGRAPSTSKVRSPLAWSRTAVWVPRPPPGPTPDPATAALQQAVATGRVRVETGL